MDFYHIGLRYIFNILTFFLYVVMNSWFMFVLEYSYFYIFFPPLKVSCPILLCHPVVLAIKTECV